MNKTDAIIFSNKNELSQIQEENKKLKLSKQEQLDLLTHNQRDQKDLDKLNKNSVLHGDGKGDVEAKDLALTVLTGGLYAVFKAIASIVNKVDDEVKDYQINGLKKEILEEKIAERKEMSGILGTLKQLHELSKDPSKIEDYQELHAKVNKVIEKSQFLPEEQKKEFTKTLSEHKNTTETKCAQHYEKKMDNAIVQKDSKSVKQCITKLSHVENKISENNKEAYSAIKEKIVDDKGQIKMHSKTELGSELISADGKKDSLLKNIKVENKSEIKASNIANGSAVGEQAQGK